MTDGQHRPLAGDVLPVRLHSGERTVFDRNTGQRRAEAHFTAVFDDLAAHFTNYILEDIRADVRLRLFDDIRRSTVRGKDFQHVVAQRITDARGQLAVRVGAGAALTELDIAVGIERTALPERIHNFVALVQISAALEHERTIAVLCQHIGGEQSRRTETDHHRTVLEPLFAVRNDDFRIGFITHEGHLQFFRKCLFVERRVQAHRIYPADLSAPRVNADATDRRLYVVCRQTGQPACLRNGGLLRQIKRQTDAGYHQAHWLPPPFLVRCAVGSATVLSVSSVLSVLSEVIVSSDTCASVISISTSISSSTSVTPLGRPTVVATPLTVCLPTPSDTES